MKKYIISLLLIAGTAVLQSCDDSFSPKGEFLEGYTLYCVLDGNSTHQEAYLLKNYDPVGFDAVSYDKNRTVSNALIKIKSQDAEFEFKDTSEFKESFGYSVDYYTLENFDPAQYKGQRLYITAETHDGKLLYGQTPIDTKLVNFSASTRKELEHDVFDSLRVIFVNNNFFKFTPFLILNYRKIDNGDTVYYHKELPYGYSEENGRRIPLYPDYKSRNYFNYSIADIAYEIEQIAKERKPGGKIKMLNLTLGVLQVTNPLDVYYKTNKTNSDGFSIRTYEPNISNIENANGIFAYKEITSINILFRRDWNGFFSDKELEQL